MIEKAKTVRIMAGDKILDAKVVAADAGLDIAILEVEGQGYLRYERYEKCEGCERG